METNSTADNDLDFDAVHDELVQLAGLAVALDHLLNDCGDSEARRATGPLATTISARLDALARKIDSDLTKWIPA